MDFTDCGLSGFVTKAPLLTWYSMAVSFSGHCYLLSYSHRDHHLEVCVRLVKKFVTIPTVKIRKR